MAKHRKWTVETMNKVANLAEESGVKAAALFYGVSMGRISQILKAVGRPLRVRKPRELSVDERNEAVGVYLD